MIEFMKILMVSSEIFPMAKTGGLADVVGSLSPALSRLGVQVALVMPAYQIILENSFPLEDLGLEIEVPLGSRYEKGRVLKTFLQEGLPVYFIRADRYFFREGLYGTSQGDYPDNAERFAFFSKATLELARRTAPWDIFHCHDWQTALIPVEKKIHPCPEIQKSKTLLTIHNLGYQGIFPVSEWQLLNLDRNYFTPRYLEFYGNFNLLKGGILLADALTTVSKKYANEIKTPEYGCGLDGVIRDREKDLYGILNGVDYQEWNPETDPYIKKNYGARHLRGKTSCKKDLQAIYGLPLKGSVPLFGIVSRLTDQKGFDILVEVIEDLMQLDLQLVVLGTGEQKYEDLLAELPTTQPEKIGLKIGYDNVLAHKIEAGADLFLMPSKYEPCGLNQIYSLRYGTIPVVRATGGLDDTVKDYNPITGEGNGFKFSAYSGPTLLETIKRAIAVYSNRKAWRQLMAKAMDCDFSWKESAAAYLALYRQLLETPS
ncbi:MAG: glycogen synthase GlgA [Deltaproteobacteria bacterium]|nr:glycogen synthase GlgA [Deltaproteobacteria bacterium]